eukprot:6182378-Pleurochrysis_carterae.AAC.5
MRAACLERVEDQVLVRVALSHLRRRARRRRCECVLAAFTATHEFASEEYRACACWRPAAAPRVSLVAANAQPGAGSESAAFSVALPHCSILRPLRRCVYVCARVSTRVSTRVINCACARAA